MDSSSKGSTVVCHRYGVSHSVIGDDRFLVVKDGEFFIDTEADPFVPEGSKVVNHQKMEKFPWDPARVELFLSPKQSGSHVVFGRDLYPELKDKPVLNANVLDFLLKHQELIPLEWRQNDRNIFFWGTVYSDDEADFLFVRCLYWTGDTWDWFYDAFNGLWANFMPAAVLAS